MALAAPRPDDVSAALEELLGWPDIARSPQLAKFLTYIVGKTLSGEEAAIKAYAIAVDVFGRPSSFDPQSDPIVRVQARRLRALLEQFYAEGRGRSGVRITLPTGRYVPQFIALEADVPAGPAKADAVSEPVPVPPGDEEQRLDAVFAAAAAAPARFAPSRLFLVSAVVAAMVLGAGVVAWLALFDRFGVGAAAAPGPPRIVVQEFVGVVSGGSGHPSVAGLALELVTDLALFGDIDPGYGGVTTAATASRPGYLFSGVARFEADQSRYSAILRRIGADASLWTLTVEGVGEPGRENIDAVSRAFAFQLGSPRGPLHADARAWVATESELAQFATDYVCRLAFSYYRETRNRIDADRAAACARGLLADQRDSPVGLAISGALMLDFAYRADLLAPDPEVLREAAALIARATEFAPTDSFVWEQRARLFDAEGRVEEAGSAFGASLQLNPANLDALAAFACMLSLRGDSPEGRDLAAMALAADPAPPFWYHAAPAVNALRAGDDAAAIVHAELLSRGDAELGSVVAIAAAIGSDEEDVLNRFLPAVLELPRFRQYGIMPVVSRRIGDTEVVRHIRAGLLQTGIAVAALDNPF